jgi:hypothetical protein
VSEAFSGLCTFKQFKNTIRNLYGVDSQNNTQWIIERTGIILCQDSDSKSFAELNIINGDTLSVFCNKLIPFFLSHIKDVEKYDETNEEENSERLFEKFY